MNETFEKYLEEDRQALAKIEKEYGPLSEADRVFFLKCASQSRRPSTPEEKRRAEENARLVEEYIKKLEEEENQT